MQRARGLCHNLGWHFVTRISPYVHGLVLQMRKLRFGVVGPVNRRTEIKMEASVAPSWPLKCILLLEGREEDGTQQPTPEDEAFPEVGVGVQDKWERSFSARGPAALPGFWPVTTQVPSFQAEVPRQRWSRSGPGGSPAPQAWGGEGWETPGATA